MGREPVSSESETHVVRRVVVAVVAVVVLLIALMLHNVASFEGDGPTPLVAAVDSGPADLRVVLESDFSQEELDEALVYAVFLNGVLVCWCAGVPVCRCAGVPFVG